MGLCIGFAHQAGELTITEINRRTLDTIPSFGNNENVHRWRPACSHRLAILSSAYLGLNDGSLDAEDCSDGSRTMQTTPFSNRIVIITNAQSGPHSSF
jgi:hypothetical protein